ncbi:MAG TPA: ATP-binding protein, partial [Anaerolineae bacterium]|nr:ATP-binding protein [Anaerolineae bacterium]
AAVWGGARVEAARLLAEGVEAGLIWGVGENYALLAMMAETEGEGEGIYRFAHEQIQQLFYEEGGAEQHERWHLGIGRYWREDWSEEEQTERVFDLVDQFNRGRAGIDDRDELIELARLNERAARRAQGAAAYDVAAGYYQEALGLWAAVGGGWSANREEILRLYEGASMVAYMGRAYERMEELVRVVMGLTDDLYERMPFHEVQILALIAQNERVKGTELALQVLAELGETFPERPRPWHTVWELLKVRRALKGRSAEALLDLPEMSDRRALAVVTILGRAIAAVFFAVPELYPLMALRRVLLSVRYGNAPLSVSAYGGYGLLLSFLGQYEAGEAFGKMSLKLVDKLGAHELRTRAEMIHYSFIAHWRHHLRDSWERMIAVEQSGTETGDVEYAAYGAVNDAIYGFYLESSLDKMTTEIEREIGLIRQFGQTSSQYVVMALGQVIENLRVEKEEPWVLVGKFYDENEIVPILEADRDLGGLYFYGMQKALLYYMFGQYKEAWQWAIDTEQYVESMRGTATVAFHVFQRALMGAAYWGEVDAGEQKKILKQVKKDYKRIKKWAVVGPMNMGYRERLVAAELARMGGKGEMAIEAYEAAIEQAQANGYYWYGALAYEVAGDFYARAGMDKVANVYWWESRYRYEQWGAMAKVAEMDRVHEALAVRASARVTPSRRAADIAATMNPMTLTTGGRTTTGSNEMFDLSTVVAASEVIFSEIELEALLQKLMRLVIENAGAERGILLLVEDEALVVRAAGDAEEVVVTEVGLTAYGSLPVSLIQYVRRTQERVVLRSANEQGLFTKDTYIRSEGVKSVLAVPLVNQGQLVAILYLENNLSAGVFTAERENIIYLLGVQAAISITNAQAFAVRAEQARLEMEKQLLAEQAAELAKINADKDRFFSIISHDLRSPFNPVMGLAQLMMIDAENFKPADVAEMSTQIYDSSRHVLTLLESLLQWSRIQTGRMPYEPELIDLADLALKTVDLLSGMSGEKRVTLMHMVPAGVMVMADEPMMATVVRNLVSNALKFTPEGGQVLINVYEVGAEEVVFGVADTGVGMPKEVQEKLFRLDTHHTTEGTAGEKGTGLGLVMCQELVEKNGGRIWVESELGEGTVFKVGLPKG